MRRRISNITGKRREHGHPPARPSRPWRAEYTARVRHGTASGECFLDVSYSQFTESRANAGKSRVCSRLKRPRGSLVQSAGPPAKAAAPPPSGSASYQVTDGVDVFARFL